MLPNVLEERFRETLETELGPALLAGVRDPDVNEILVNPGGLCYFDCQSSGLVPQPDVSPARIEALASTIATYSNKSFNADNPSLEATLPFHGARFTATRPPITREVAITLRKRNRLYRLEPDFVTTGIICREHADLLLDALNRRLNIIVCGGLGTGKSALANALLMEIGDGTRVGILEDTPEIHCPNIHAVNFYSTPTHDLETLAGRTSFRFRFDRICLGEIRDREALALLKAWTSLRGGIATLHADDPEGALGRLELLVRLAGPSLANIARLLIGGAIDMVVHIEGRNTARRVATLLSVHGYDEHRSTYRLTRHERTQ
jgi:type IV secretion system protein TrbB